MLIIIISLMILPTEVHRLITFVFMIKSFNCSSINTIAQDSTGFVWIGTDYGLNRFDGAHLVRNNYHKKDKSSLLNMMSSPC